MLPVYKQSSSWDSPLAWFPSLPDGSKGGDSIDHPLLIGDVGSGVEYSLQNSRQRENLRKYFMPHILDVASAMNQNTSKVGIKNTVFTIPIPTHCLVARCYHGTMEWVVIAIYQLLEETRPRNPWHVGPLKVGLLSVNNQDETHQTNNE